MDGRHDTARMRAASARFSNVDWSLDNRSIAELLRCSVSTVNRRRNEAKRRWRTRGKCQKVLTDEFMASLMHLREKAEQLGVPFVVAAKEACDAWLKKRRFNG